MSQPVALTTEKKQIPIEFTVEFNKGLKALEAQNTEEAERHFLEAAKQCPEAWLGIACEEMGKGNYLEAIKRFQQVIETASHHVTRSVAYNNLAAMTLKYGNRPSSLKYSLESYKLWRNPHAASNAALGYMADVDVDNALRWIERAIRHDPKMRECYFTRALLWLLKGDFERGFRDYEVRWTNPHTDLKKLAVFRPEWTGGDLTGKTILVYGEQGTGDTIQMLRYGRLLKERARTTILAPQIGLGGIAKAQGCWDYVYEDLPGRINTGNVPEYDVQIPAMSLPFRFGTTLDTIPQAPYIPKTGWIKEPLPEKGRFNVGIAWAGSLDHQHDRWRSTELEAWQPLFDLPATFYSFQLGPRTLDLLAGNYPVIDLSPKLKTFADSAGFIEQLDLVIAVDTSIVHLCGAMGTPIWMACPFQPDWRWLLNRTDSPWYPSLRLFRAPAEREWQPVFEEMAAELANWMAPISSK